ncbi:MAG: MotA/TolQ/ExbB proton channel family protein [Deltaproteobacteria bacterium]|nr:MotA/TolQ/ExbB proton channel family protein [Deltaproteobacteria bacterium]
MWEIETFAVVRAFIEQGGNVLLVIAFVTAVMWTLILERFWYFSKSYRQDAKRTQALWNARADHGSWNSKQIRRVLISDLTGQLNWGLGMIGTLVALCPMLGLLGTVTGMIEVFDVMAAGGGNTRGMAAGVSKATLPTMAGMVAAISGMLFHIQLERFAEDASERVADRLEVTVE